MTSHVEVQEAGAFRVTLTYEAADLQGTTSAHGDTYRARFTRRVPDELVVEVDELETADPRLAGEMTMTVTPRERDGGTELLAVHEGVPAGVAPGDNERGWRTALDRLAAFVEA